MKKIKVGYGRFYNANGTTLINTKEVAIQIKVGHFNVDAFLGPHIKHSIWSGHLSEEKIPKPHLFPAEMYLELEVTEELEVSDSLFEDFYHTDITIHKRAREEVYQFMEQKKEIYFNCLNYVAGYIGLRFHFTLVYKKIVEQWYTYLNEKNYGLRSGISLRIVDTFSFTEAKDSKKIGDYFPPLIKEWEWERAARILNLLLQAWEGEDKVLIFISLFAALECVIPGIPTSENQQWKETQNALMELINENGKPDNSKELETFINQLKFAPFSLSRRFEIWAQEIALDDWERDIIAFREFAKMRNAFVHRGQANLDLRIETVAGEVSTLVDLAERYVCFALFGDAHVYKRNFAQNETDIHFSANLKR